MAPAVGGPVDKQEMEEATLPTLPRPFHPLINTSLQRGGCAPSAPINRFSGFFAGPEWGRIVRSYSCKTLEPDGLPSSPGLGHLTALPDERRLAAEVAAARRSLDNRAAKR